MKARLANLGIFATLMEVWGRFPQGGIEGDYVIVDGKELAWNKYDHTWGSSPVSGTEVIRPVLPSPGSVLRAEELEALRSELASQIKALEGKIGALGGIAPLDADGYVPARHLSPESHLEHQLQEALSDSISPLTARVMRLLQGDPALQFVFVESVHSPRRVEHVVRYDAGAKKLSVPEGVIRHLTLGLEGVSPSRPLSDYKTWVLPALEEEVGDEVRNLYLYARCSKVGTSGTFVTSPTLLPLEGTSGDYDLLVGMLSAPPARRFTALYGLVEIPSAMLRIDKLMSPDGEFVIDLVRKEIRGAKTSFASGGADAGSTLESLLAQAKAYTDEKGEGLKGYVETKSTSTRTYIDGKITEAGRKLGAQTKELTKELKGYTDSKAEEGRSYTTAQLEELRESLKAGLSGVTALNEKLAHLQAQVDGKVSNWYFAGAPSAEGAPTKDWTTDELRRAHIGDTFTSLDKAPSPNAGKSWRYSPDFRWEEVVDSDSLKALQLATEAKAAADGKTTTYLSKPASYQRGDSWVITEPTAVGATTHPRGAVLFAQEDASAFDAQHWLRLDDYISAVEAKGYTESKSSQALRDAKQYADQGDKATSQRIDQRSSDTLTGAKNYADGKIAEAKAYAEDKDIQLRRELSIAQTESANHVMIVAERLAQEKADEAKAYTDAKLKSQQDGAASLAYLRRAITDGTTDVSGGLILSSFLGARDPETKAVRSFIAGSTTERLPAFAAGVSAFATPQEKRVVEINHDGTGHWGKMKVEQGGARLRIGSMVFGDKLPTTFTQDFRTLGFQDDRTEQSRIYIGEEGALFFFGLSGASARYVRLSNKQDKPVLEVRGKVDIPGVLLAATVSSSPVKFVRKWGAPEFTVDRPSGWGRYVFRHKLGHTNYVVQATAIGDPGAYCVLTELEADRFAVTVYRHGNPSDSHAFNVLVIGDN